MCHFISSIMRKAEEEDCIKLCQGNPDIPMPSFVSTVLKEKINEIASFQYPPFTGLTELKQGIASFYFKKFGAEISEEEVVIVPGGKTGLFLASKVLSGKNRKVLLPDICYPDMLHTVESLGIKKNFFQLKKEKEYKPDFCEIKKIMSEGIDFIYLNYPNNPTGAVADTEMFENSVKFAEQNHLFVFHDYAYGTIAFDEQKVSPSLMSVPGAKHVGIELFSFSKMFNMAGLRIACLIGNRQVIEKVEALVELYFTGIYKPIQYAALGALSSDGENYVKGISRLYKRRMTIALNNLGENSFFVPDSTFYLWVNTPKQTDGVDFFNQLLTEKKIAIMPGIGFGEGNRKFYRLSLVQSEKIIDETTKKIREYYL